MNINNLLKSGILACAMVFSISNNANAITHHNVNSKVFQHDIRISNNNIKYAYYTPKKKIYVKNPETNRLEEMYRWYSNEQYKTCADDHNEYNYPEYNCTVYHLNDNNNNQINDIDVKNKFNELYKKKITSGVFADTITSFENAVHRVFGSDYKVVTSISDILSQYPENLTHERKLDNTEKDFVKINKENDVIYISYQLYSTLENNNMELVTQYDYQWNASDILFYIFHSHQLIITNGKNVICYDNMNDKIRVYTKLNYFKMKDPYSELDLNKKFDEFGLILREKYEAEKRAVREVFGQDFLLEYS